ncbi:hypothetical protein LPJ66_012020 [Kickxella alabastrina]|uniref:Uncharacterized protein n=1 Tax=Kickxella alabastrina TaxID=61397 RepID=A0ACC1I051_9FUNG|nr:hypothetical protein LPJ66_012020 [Kickxella alabastrina]
MSKSIAIVGATGLQGGSVLKALHATGKYRIRGLTRDTTSASAKTVLEKYPGVELAKADLDDIASLRQAFKGADIVFGVTQFNPTGKLQDRDRDQEYEHGKAIVDAAIAEGVKSLVFSSLDSMKVNSHGKYPGVKHFESKHKVEEYISSKADQIRGYFVYVGFYMDNYVNFSRLSPEDGKTVEFTFPLKPTTKLPLVDTANDVGYVVSYILDHPEECLETVIEASSGYYEAQDMVNAFTEVTGIPARYVQIPYEYLGMEEMVQMFKGIEEFGLFNGRTEFIERCKEYDHKLTTPTEFWKNRGWTGPAK